MVDIYVIQAIHTHTHTHTHTPRMFGSSMENQLTLKSNDHGEYEVAKGVTATLFRAILVSWLSMVTLLCLEETKYSVYLHTHSLSKGQVVRCYDALVFKPG